MDVTDSLEVNRRHWDERAPAHAASADYQVQQFIDDPGHLSDVVRFDRALLGDLAGRVVVLGELDGGVGERAAAIVFLAGAFGEAVEEGQQLAARIPWMVGHGLVPAGPEADLGFAEHGDGELVLRAEGTVEAGLGDAGLGDNLVDAHRADALAVEQLAGGVADLVDGAAGWIGFDFSHLAKGYGA